MDDYEHNKTIQPIRNQSLKDIVQSQNRTFPASSRLPIQARDLPAVPTRPQAERAQRQPVPKPALPQTLTFNCPACMAVLTISRDLAIAGTTAPCPHCASVVIPPQIAPTTARKPVPRSTWHPRR